MKKLLLVALLVLAACSPGLDVDTYPTVRGTDVDCKALYADAPAKVAGQDSILVSDDTAIAWGAPAIILRCGVEEPEVLAPEKIEDTPACNFVDGVDWVTETTSDGYLFTTIGRTFYVSLEVPKAYDPAADALADVAEAVKKHDPSVKPCV